MGAKDLHQGEMEAEERGWRSPEFGEVLFPKSSDLPRRSHVSKSKEDLDKRIYHFQFEQQIEKSCMTGE
ncbi:hypothetical protein L345_12619 [Ophiophagus hannah]|uniref:Uncharacterized protein n=1 Tax=Ophiophagus hannah TaxID=8665 RepID=V8NJ12_OPHHA|nr:hypothetical protein L345_12619 [Ophiophagus hannah]